MQLRYVAADSDEGATPGSIVCKVCLGRKEMQNRLILHTKRHSGLIVCKMCLGQEMQNRLMVVQEVI